MNKLPRVAAPYSLRAFRTAVLTSTSLLSLVMAVPPTARAADEVIDGGASVTVKGDGSGGVASPWNIDGFLSVGRDSAGSLTISDGAAVNSTGGYVGRYAGSSGTVVVTGAGSNWTTSSSLYVGMSGSGILTISDGATVSGTSGDIGYSANSSGTASVTGAGSKWTTSTTLNVATFGSGLLTIADGGTVTSDRGVNIGSGGGSSGTITVAGAGSNLAGGTELRIGELGTGTLTVTGGATVSSKIAYVGGTSGGTGLAEIRGAGSSWVNDTQLFVGA